MLVMHLVIILLLLKVINLELVSEIFVGSVLTTSTALVFIFHAQLDCTRGKGMIPEFILIKGSVLKI